MSTRSLTRIFDNAEQIVCMYRQSDGYPDGMGRDLAEFLNDITLVNGLSFDQSKRVANGSGCLAAQIVARFKKGPGGIYLYPINIENADQEYEYEVQVTEGIEIRMTCYEVCGGDSITLHKLFTGTPAGFLLWLETEEGKAA